MLALVNMNAMYYNWYRYYDPSLGRYITPDPIGLQGGRNPYVYVTANPLYKYDFFGIAPGDPYPTRDVAARSALRDIYESSITNDREYAGKIYRNPDGTYSYTSPKEGSAHYSSLGGIPRGTKDDGTYHSHGAECGPTRDNENFSPTDKNYAKKTGEPIYLIPPSGVYKKYDPISDTKSNIVSLSELQPTSDKLKEIFCKQDPKFCEDNCW